MFSFTSAGRDIVYDPRMVKLADVLVGYSTEVKEGDVVYVEAFDIPPEMVEVLVDRIYQAGGVPLISMKSNRVLRKLYRGASEVAMKTYGEVELEKMRRSQVYIGMRGSHNITELSDVPEEKMNLYKKHWWEPVHIKWRVPKTRWVVLRWPTPSMAQQAEMSTEAFEDFYFSTCTMDYSRMSKAMDPLKALMERTDEVVIKGPGTDLRFSIRGIPSVKCDGKLNIPDGEIFTAPVRDSVEGVISFNTPTVYDGKIFTDVRLRFKEGRIVEATSSDTKALNKILDTDEGARYTGEFAIGLNPYVTRPMKDILFDEKIAGSIHLTPGNAYDEAFNGNRSRIHWDMVLIQTKEWGGGEIYFDGELVRKDGLFVMEELKGLNPENLKG